jgi:hypothetical protein
VYLCLALLLHLDLRLLGLLSLLGLGLSDIIKVDIHE